MKPVQTNKLVTPKENIIENVNDPELNEFNDNENDEDEDEISTEITSKQFLYLSF